MAESVGNFFVLDDRNGGTYNFSVTSVRTNNYIISPGIATSITLALLGSTLDRNLGFSPTPSSMTLTLSKVGGSAYFGSATLAILPQSPSVPEASSWAMWVIGVGGIGCMMRRRTRAYSAFAPPSL